MKSFQMDSRRKLRAIFSYVHSSHLVCAAILQLYNTDIYTCTYTHMHAHSHTAVWQPTVSLHTIPKRL